MVLLMRDAEFRLREYDPEEGFKPGQVFNELPGRVSSRERPSNRVWYPLIEACKETPHTWVLIKTGSLASMRASKSNITYGRFKIPPGNFEYEVTRLEVNKTFEELGYDPELHAGLFCMYLGEEDEDSLESSSTESEEPKSDRDSTGHSGSETGDKTSTRDSDVPESTVSELQDDGEAVSRAPE